MNEERKVYTVEEVGRLLGWSRVKAYQAAKDGTLPSIRHGRRVIVPRAALDRWLETAGAVGESGARVV